MQRHGAVFSAAPAKEDWFWFAHRRLVPAAELVFESQPEIPAERRKPDGVLILLVQEVADAAIGGQAITHEVACSDIESRVTRIASQAEPVEAAVGAHPREIPGAIEVEPAEGRIEPQVSRVHRAAKEMIARLFHGWSRVHRLEHARIVERIVAIQREPARQLRSPRPIHATGAGEVRIEIQIYKAAEAHGICVSHLLVDQIAKLIRKVSNGNAKTVRGKILIDTHIDGAAPLRTQRRIAGVARIRREGFENRGFLDPLSVR